MAGELDEKLDALAGALKERVLAVVEQTPSKIDDLVATFLLAQFNGEMLTKLLCTAVEMLTKLLTSEELAAGQVTSEQADAALTAALQALVSGN